MSVETLITTCLLPLNLPEQELESLSNTLGAAMRQRVDELNSLIEAARAQIQLYETKYNMDYEKFRGEGVNPGAIPTEDYVNWGFWVRVNNNRMGLLARYNELLEDNGNC